MDDLDRALARLAAAPAPRTLDGIDAAVFARIEAQATPGVGAVGIGAMAVVALTIGMIGAELPATAQPAVSLAPLSGSSPLAPSSLLVGEP